MLVTNTSDESPSEELVNTVSQTEDFINVYGVIFPRYSMPSEPQDGKTEEPALVHTTELKSLLKRIALGVSLKTPILIQGPSGCGKTAIVQEAARLLRPAFHQTGNASVVKIHLGDQTDSKILLGTYVSTPVPGTFRYQQGVLTTAVINGDWILIEDIDLAPDELVSVLLPLVESRILAIPSRGERIVAHSDFRIFATRSRHYAGTGIADGLWDRISMNEISRENVEIILTKLYPDMAGRHVTMIIDAYFRVQEALIAHRRRQRAGSLSDLIKLCARYIRVILPSLEVDADGGDESLFREAVDCFAGMISDGEIRLEIQSIIGTAFGIPEHRIGFFAGVFVPMVTLTEDSDLQAGRVSLPVIKRKKIAEVNDGPVFAMLSHSLKLLEKIGVCVRMNEPVLLVGETGCGKTSVVQRLASLCGKDLNVINMSQQSDSSDLLGGFKPVDARFLARPLKKTFDFLFSQTFSVKKNAAFVKAVDRFFSRGKWEQLGKAFFNGYTMAQKVFGADARSIEGGESPGKRVKLDQSIMQDWDAFYTDAEQFIAQLDHIRTRFLFHFVEGTLVQAVKNGDWVLLDEVNLASQETLECLSSLLQSSDGSLLLMEKGDTVPVKRHPDFRLFACMNPATDAGKRDLPPGLHSRFVI
jgi:midasin